MSKLNEKEKNCQKQLEEGIEEAKTMKKNQNVFFKEIILI